MARDADVLIAGGGPAGLSTALFLAHAAPNLAERIVVLEKERYPRDKYCAGGLGARGDLALARAGVVVSVPSVPVSTISLEVAGGEVSATDDGLGRVVRRLEFDHELARIVRARGIRIVEGARVEGVAIDPSGVSVRASTGELRARLLVGADGVGSVVRRAIGLPAGGLRAQVIELDTEPVESDPPRDVLRFDASERELDGYAWDFPTVVDGRELVCRGVYQLKIGDDPAEVDLRALLAKRLAERGLELSRHRQKRFAERGFELHRPYAVPRVVLVGEAAGIDPVTGEGIAQGIQYGAFAGPYLAEKLADGDLSFSDWNARLSRTDVGIDLGLRTRVAPLFFGRYRAAMERFLLESPAFLALGARYFAGKRVPRWPLAKVAAVAAWHTLRAGVSVSRDARLAMASSGGLG